MERYTDVERAALARADARDRAIDGAHKRRRGVVHTPVEVARYLVHKVDAGLRALGRVGIADPSVTLVDPACGPGIFLASSLNRAQAGSAPRAVLGMDVDPDALRHAAGALRQPMADAGWMFRLIEADTLAAPPPLTEGERKGATLAIIGNPPWAGRSPNRGVAYTEALLDPFRRDSAGVRLDEKKIGVLSDDYVRFFSWAADAARRADGGAVVALVTNASFLDGPVHRGMRAALTRWFDHIEVTDLGGSALIARRGDRDENVFAVRPAVAVTVMRRGPRTCDSHELEGRLEGTVTYARLRGSRAAKLEALGAAPTHAGIAARAPAVRFVPEPERCAQYEGWPSLVDLMPFHREGLQTNRDELCIADDRNALISRLRAFVDGDWTSHNQKSAHYDPEVARRAAAAALDGGEGILPIAYRPFDDRWVAAVPGLCHRARPALLAAMAHSELALLTVRKDRGERAWTHFGVTQHAVDNCFLSTRSSCRTRAFPTHQPDGSPNLNREALSKAGFGFAADDVGRFVAYALCVLASPKYRERFDAQLRADYPRIPPPRSDGELEVAAAAGAEVVEAFTRGEPLSRLGRRPSETRFELGHHAFAASSRQVRELQTALSACDDVIAGRLAVGSSTGC